MSVRLIVPSPVRCCRGLIPVPVMDLWNGPQNDTRPLEHTQEIQCGVCGRIYRLTAELTEKPELAVSA